MSSWNFSVCCIYIKIDWIIYEHRLDNLDNLYCSRAVVEEGEKYSPSSRGKNNTFFRKILQLGFNFSGP